MFSIYVTYPFFHCLRSIVQAEGVEVTSGNKHVSSGKEMSPSTIGAMTATLSWAMTCTQLHTGKNKRGKLKQQLSHENVVRQNSRSQK